MLGFLHPPGQSGRFCKPVTNQIGLKLNLWCANHREDLALKDTEKADDFKDFFAELRNFFNSIGFMIAMSPEAHDELTYFGHTMETCRRANDKCSMSISWTRNWNRLKPVINLLAEKYPAFIVLTRRSPGFERHTGFLLRPQTYFKVHILADILNIYEVAIKEEQKVAAKSPSLALDVVGLSVSTHSRNDLKGTCCDQRPDDNSNT